MLLELFTSQSCSSCPPAETLLSRLLQTQPVAGVRLLALSEHVDYWNSTGWRDPFSAALFTHRQSNYAAGVFHSGEVYTPQLVVDGQWQAVGSDRGAVFDAIRQAAASPPRTLDVFTQRQSRALQIKLTATAPSDTDLWLALTRDDVATHVGSGENGGRHLLEDAVTLTLRKLPPSATMAMLPIPSGGGGTLHVIVFAQRRGDAAIVAVGDAPVAAMR